MNYDITFCSKKNCNNLKCVRNQKNLPNAEKVYLFWMNAFKECKYWEENYDRR